MASDADVTVIAAHMCRFALDILIGNEPSAFPYSAYFVGLSRGWIFSEPFQTLPFEAKEVEEDRGEARASRATVDFLADLVSRTSSADNPPE